MRKLLTVISSPAVTFSIVATVFAIGWVSAIAAVFSASVGWPITAVLVSMAIAVAVLVPIAAGAAIFMEVWMGGWMSRSRLRKAMEARAEELSARSLESASADMRAYANAIRDRRLGTVVEVRYRASESKPRPKSKIDLRAFSAEICTVLVQDQEQIDRYSIDRSSVLKITREKPSPLAITAQSGYWQWFSNSSEPIYSVYVVKQTLYQRLFDTFNPRTIVPTKLYSASGSLLESVRIEVDSGACRNSISIEVPIGFGRPLYDELVAWIYGQEGADFTIVDGNADSIEVAPESVEIPVTSLVPESEIENP